MTYEFKVGDKRVTKETGEPYEVIAFDKRLPQPLIVLLQQDGKCRLETYNLDGTYFLDGRHCPRDLIPPPRKLTLYVNMYEGTYYGYPSESSARDCAGHGALKIAHKVEFEIEGGAP